MTLGVTRRPLVILAGLVLLGLAVVLHRYMSLEALVAERDVMRQTVARHGLLAVCAFALVYAVTVALSVPGAVFLTIGSGTLFGGWLGGAVSVLAATGGAILVFLAARTAFGRRLAGKAGPRLTRIMAGFRSGAASYLLFLRLVPLFPFALVNLAPALAGVRLSTFAWTTFIGIAPATFAFAFAGAGLDDILKTHAETYQACRAAGRDGCQMNLTLDAFLNRNLLFAFGALGIIALIPTLWRRIWKRELPSPEQEPRS